MHSTRSITVVLWLSLAAPTLSAQHAFTPEEVAEGGRMFQSTCTTCHGEDGASIPGVPLATGTFRSGASDATVVGFIRDGIPGTGMPSFANLTEEDAAKIVAFLRSGGTALVADLASGDPERGRALFESSGCLNCHRVNGRGGRLGPDLSRIGQPPPVTQAFGAEPPPTTTLAERLEMALLEPNAVVEPDNRVFEVITSDGRTVTGRLMNHDTFTISLLDANAGQLVTFRKGDLEAYAMIDSPMPSYRDRMDSEELTDLVRYLLSLRGAQRQ